MKIKVLIVDDDVDSRVILSSYITTNHPELILAGEADSLLSASEMVSQLKPELLLLDISLPDGTAFELLNKFPDKNFEVIFITGFNNYAIQAFKMAAIDYLLKPVSYTELSFALNRAKSRLEEKYFTEHWKTLLHNSLQQSQYEKKLAIATSEGFLFVLISDITRLESHSNYTYFYFKNGKKLVSSRTLGYYEELLPEDRFCRIHHSHLVNTDYIVKYNKGGAGGTLVMQDGMELAVSQRKREFILKKLIGNSKE